MRTECCAQSRIALEQQQNWGCMKCGGTGLMGVEHPSDALLGQKSDDEGLSGTAVSAALEGARPMLVEVQALVSTAVYGTPQRSGDGF